MTERVLGEKGSKKRRRFLFLPVLATTVMALFWISGAQAVHDFGIFELDRNAVQDDATPPPEDWATLYAGGSNSGGDSDSFTDILADNTLTNPLGSLGTQFHAGGSKDDLDITQWLWNPGEPLDKDDITDAYAAAYTYNGAEVCSPQPPAPGIDPCTSPGDLILYFGLDRFSAAGSAQIGFWFLQDPEFGLTTTAKGGGHTFSGIHQDGDVLVQSNFSGGGVIDNVTVYSWEGGSLQQVFSAADCIGPPPSAANDPACMTVMRADTANKTAPWPYTPKANEGSPGTFLAGGFVEGGINITRLVPDASCFANFLAETRTSTPFDARLKDFVSGTFESCEAGITTTPNPAGPITLGQSSTDKALVEGTGLNAPTPTGTVKFYICSPAQLTNGACESPNPNSPTGTLVSTETLTPTADPNDTAAEAESDPFTPNAIGTWCWRGEYSGDGFYDPDTDASTGECFLVVTIPTTTTTAQSWTPNDSATVSTTGPPLFNLTGSVAFSLYDNNACSGTALYSQTRPIPANSGLGPVTVSTTNGNGIDGVDEPPNDRVITTPGGTFSWLVVYTPDPSDTAHTGSSSICDDEHSVLTINNNFIP